jgi:hypothetical protein
MFGLFKLTGDIRHATNPSEPTDGKYARMVGYRSTPQNGSTRNHSQA